MKVFEQEEEVVVYEGEMSHVMEETGAYNSFLTLIKFTSIQRGLIDYIIAIRKW